MRSSLSPSKTRHRESHHRADQLTKDLVVLDRPKCGDPWRSSKIPTVISSYYRAMASGDDDESNGEKKKKRVRIAVRTAGFRTLFAEQETSAPRSFSGPGSRRGQTAPIECCSSPAGFPPWTLGAHGHPCFLLPKSETGNIGLPGYGRPAWSCLMG